METARAGNSELLAWAVAAFVKGIANIKNLKMKWREMIFGKLSSSEGVSHKRPSLY